LLFTGESHAQSKTSNCSEVIKSLEASNLGADGKVADAEPKSIAERSPVERSSPMPTLKTKPDLRILTASLESADGPPSFPAESSWDATRTFVGSGAQQKGAFRVINGGIYHLDQNHPVGMASLDVSGTLHLVFHGHRKFSGEAVVSKVANGHWAGLIVMPDGSEWRLDMKRR
jgi:hypothetical protein